MMRLLLAILLGVSIANAQIYAPFKYLPPASAEPQTLGISMSSSGANISWSSFPYDSVTVCLWVKRNGAGSASQESIFSYSWTGSAAYRFVLSHDGTNYEYYEKAYAYTDFGYQPVSGGDWMFVAVTYDSASGDTDPLKYYIGREGDASLTEVSTIQYSIGNKVDNMVLGTDAWSKWFNGEFAYLRIWKAVLTKAQLEAEMDSTTPVVTAGIWFANDLDGATGCNTDESGAGHNGTVNGTITDGSGGPF